MLHSIQESGTASAVKTPSMINVRIEVMEGESIGKALRRLHKCLWKNGVSYEQKKHARRIKPSEARHYKRLIAEIRKRQAAFLRRHQLGY